MFAKFIFNLGKNYRNPSLTNWFLFLKKTEQWSLIELESYQLEKLKELVTIAYNNSEYYKNKFDELGLKIYDIQTLKDISKLPILTKELLLTNNTKIHTTLNFKNFFLATTSGTSGESLKFKREESADSFNRASIYRGYSWYNVKPWKKNGYFWGFNFFKIEKLKVKLLDLLQNRFRVFDYKLSTVQSFSKKLKKATYLHGYSSMIYETAKIINEENFEKPTNLKMIKGTSEKIFDSYQSEIQNAFGIKMISEYGATESGIIAFECPFGNMHINMEGVIVEEIDHQIVVTNLQMHSFPIIRYKLGDYIKLSTKNSSCSCGKKHLIINEVTGRVGENIYGKEQIYPSLYFYYIFKNLSKKHQLFLTYQVIQNTKGNLDFYIEQSLSKNEIAFLKKEINSYFKDDIISIINHSQKIVSKNKKMKSFISNIH